MEFTSTQMPQERESPSPKASSRLDYIPCLDGLRAVAALLVIAFHVFDSGEGGRLLQKLGPLLRSGVDLFFVLSGFLITRVLLFSKGAPHAYKNFYVRRILRIMPLYFLGLLLYLLIVPAYYGRPLVPLSRQIWSWLYLANIPETFHALRGAGPPHYWSLGVEEHFYLVWPFAVLMSSRRQLRKTLMWLIAAALIMRIVFAVFAIEAYFFTLTRMDALALGGALAMLVTDKEQTCSAVKWFRAAIFTLPAFIIVLFAAYSGSGTSWVQPVKLALGPLFYVVAMGLLLLDSSVRPVAQILSAKPLRWLGQRSYGLYVYHPLCFGLMFGALAGASFAVKLALGLLLTIMTSYVSFRFFETPFLRLKHRWAE